MPRYGPGQTVAPPRTRKRQQQGRPPAPSEISQGLPPRRQTPTPPRPPAGASGPVGATGEPYNPEATKQRFLDHYHTLQYLKQISIYSGQGHALDRIQRHIADLEQIGTQAGYLHPGQKDWAGHLGDIIGVGMAENIGHNLVHPIEALHGFGGTPEAQQAAADYKAGKISLEEATHRAGMSIGIVPWGVTGKAAEGRAGFMEANKPKVRPGQVGAYEGNIPAARSVSGRFVENLADAVRQPASKTGLVHSKPRIEGEQLGREQHRERQMAEVPARQLKALGKKLKPEEDYAIRMVLEGTDPSFRASAHEQFAGQSPHPELHLLHSYMARKAAQYIEMVDGHPVLRADAPKILQKALAKTREVSAGREDLIRQLGNDSLSEKAMQGRIQSPGRILHGAEWKTYEQVIQEALDQGGLPAIRQKLIESGIAPHVADAEVSMYTRLVRRAAENLYEDPTAVDAVMSRLQGVHRVEAPPEGSTPQLETTTHGTVVNPEAVAKKFYNPEPVDIPQWVKDQEKQSAFEKADQGPEGQVAAHEGFSGAPVTGDVLTQKSLFGARGAIEMAPDGETASIYLTHLADASTFPHELAHLVRKFWLSPQDEKAVAKWAGARRLPDGTYDWSKFGPGTHYSLKKFENPEEVFARGFEELLRRGIGPKGAKPEFRVVSKAMRDLYVSGSLPDLPPSVAEKLTRLFEHKKYPNTGKLVGAEDFNLGVAYVPYLRGVPVTSKAKQLTSYMKAVFNRGKILGSPHDKAMENEFKGHLLRSGFFRFDSANPTSDALISAVRMFAAHRARPLLLKAAQTADGEFRTLPDSRFDIPIKIDPSKPIGKGTSPTEGVTRMQELMQQAEASGIAVTEKDMQQAAQSHEGSVFDLAEAVREDLLPAELDGQRAEQVAADFLTGRLQQPIDNIAWIPADFMKDAGLVPEPWSPASRGRRILGTAGKVGLDSVNDVQRAIVLYLNPMYIPVNLIGNLAMNVMQQGVFLPANVWRASLFYRELSSTERMQVDAGLGHGLIQSPMGMVRSRPVQALSNPAAHIIGNIVDLQPRRLAFIHEARREGLDVAGIKRLLNDNSEESIRLRQRIFQRANDAIVDYERLSPFEKNVMTRTIFFYPWVKGATRWTERWALDHPVQALMLASAGDYAYNQANEKLGPRPEYAQLEFPVSTETLGLTLPGVGSVGLDQAVGKHTLTEKVGPPGRQVEMPMVMNPRQIFTQTTPVEFVQAGIGFVTGAKNFPDLVNNLTPALYAGGVSLFGYDPFLSKEVPKGIGTFVHTLYSPGSVPAAKDIQDVSRSKQQQENYQGRALNPRSKGEEIAQSFLSGLAPTPFNPKVAAERMLAQQGSYDRHVHELTADSKDIGMPPPTQQDLEELKVRLDFDHKLARDARGANGRMDYGLAVKMAADLYEKQTGDTSVRQYLKYAHTQGGAKHVYDWIRQRLFFHIGHYERVLDHYHNQKLYGLPASWTGG